MEYAAVDHLHVEVAAVTQRRKLRCRALDVDVALNVPRGQCAGGRGERAADVGEPCTGERWCLSPSGPGTARERLDLARRQHGRERPRGPDAHPTILATSDGAHAGAARAP